MKIKPFFIKLGILAILAILAVLIISTITSGEIIKRNGIEYEVEFVGTMEYADAKQIINLADEADVHLLLNKSICGKDELELCSYEIPTDVWVLQKDVKTFQRDVCPFLEMNLEICE